MSLEVAKNVVGRLTEAGHTAYLAGGCVRDMLLGLKPKDYDVATSATPNEVLLLFPRAKMVGAHFGVAMMDGVEIATFRKDGVYFDGRHPDDVQFVLTPEEDACRRDFTCNAMYMDPFTNEILDFFGGREAIATKVIRAVGLPESRFQEDYIRMLRAVRFAVKLGFEIAPSTLTAIRKNAHYIHEIAVERIMAELRKAFDINAAKTLDLLLHTQLYDAIFPAIDEEGVSNVAKSLQYANGFKFALAAMCFQWPADEITANLDALRVANDERDYVFGVLNLLAKFDQDNLLLPLASLKRMLRSAYIKPALDLYKALADTDECVTDGHGAFVDFMFKIHHPDDLYPAKLITGNDLLAAGMKPCKHFTTFLEEIEDMQLNEVLLARDKALEIVRDYSLKHSC
jgi:poly(A) polymerase